ncbi:hypothetical protein BC831DRAFT_453486 [Entophlyctis helioformis]|nr:hypothetical protein BC831DRAFT_453486 [Entophlyctis helioformis]
MGHEIIAPIPAMHGGNGGDDDDDDEDDVPLTRSRHQSSQSLHLQQPMLQAARSAQTLPVGPFGIPPPPSMSPASSPSLPRGAHAATANSATEGPAEWQFVSRRLKDLYTDLENDDNFSALAAKWVHRQRPLGPGMHSHGGGGAGSTVGGESVVSSVLTSTEVGAVYGPVPALSARDGHATRGASGLREQATYHRSGQL